MKKIGTLTAIGAALAVAGSLLTFPAIAGATTTTINVDCADLPVGGDFFVKPGDSLTFTTDGCDIQRGYTPQGATNVTISADELSEYSEGDPVDISFWDGTDYSHNFYLFLAGADVTNLSPLVLARTEDMTLPTVDASWFEANSDMYNDGLAGNPHCSVFEGSHPYTTVPVVITTAGDFIFRVSSTTPSTDPNSQALALDSAPFIAGEYPIISPFLAFYTTFDPSNPNENVIDCTSASDNYGDFASGLVLSTNWPQFGSTLDSGTYTLVLTTWKNYNPGDWSDNTNATDQTAAMQLWGAAGAFTPAGSSTPSSASTLPATGGSDSELPIGLSVAALGLAFVGAGAIFRRRRQKN